MSTYMMYLWSRRNKTMQISILEIFRFRAPFLPWFFLGISFLFDFNPVFDLVGISVGHMYYFLEDVMPMVPETKGIRLIKAPKAL